ncbi:MAG TPA: hypothetical protein VH722_19490, partial [Alphaproteobacteria bacterium]|nr:hypothetical protein [Alphaproteobacteria bacterium]
MIRTACCALAVLAGAGLGFGAAAAGTTKGFVVTQMAFVTNDDMKADCPGGLAESAKDYYLKSLPPAEAKRLGDGANFRELLKILYAPGGNLGPGKRTHNQCADPTDFNGP